MLKNLFSFNVFFRFPQGNLSDLGRLLLHGSFRVWTEHKNEKLKGLRLRPMQRHVFLYQRDMLFCKQREGEENQPSYTFKTKINVSSSGKRARGGMHNKVIS